MHVVYSFDVGGLENGIVNLINRMGPACFRHMVVALTRCAPSFCSRIKRQDVEFVSLHKPPGHGVRVYPQLFSLFREQRPAIVHTRNIAALEAVVPALAAGVPVRVHGEHGWDTDDQEGSNRKYQFVRKLYSPFVTHYIALSKRIESYLTGRVGIAGRRVTRICNGVDAVRFRPAAGGRELVPGMPFDDANAVLIGTVGRLQAVKDQLNLVRAFACFLGGGSACSKQARLVIAGDGPLRQQVEDEILAAGLGDRVWLAGERGDVPEVMRALDIFVLPSISEGISNTVLEAMASSLPVVATDVGGNSELVVAGETGVLVPAADSGALARALELYAANACLRRQHGLAGRARVEAEFSLDGMVDRYTSLYARLLDPRQTVRMSA